MQLSAQERSGDTRTQLEPPWPYKAADFGLSSQTNGFFSGVQAVMLIGRLDLFAEPSVFLQATSNISSKKELLYGVWIFAAGKIL